MPQTMLRTFTPGLAFAVIVSATLSGDAETALAAKNRKPVAAPSPKNSGNRKPARKVTAEIRSWKQTRKLVAKQKGKIVVLDLWTSWCEPCLKELPHLVALQKKYPKRVVTMSLNLDNIGTQDLKKEVLPNALKLLRKIKASNVKNLICSDTDEETYTAAKIDTVPTVLVFDKSGKLHKRIDVNSADGKDVSYKKHVVPVVRKLLKQ